MTKSRKVRVAGKAGKTPKKARAHAKPAVHKFTRPAKAAARHEPRHEPHHPSAKSAAPKGMVARLAAMAAASASMQDEPEMASPRKGPVSVDPFGEVEESPAPRTPAPSHPPRPATAQPQVSVPEPAPGGDAEGVQVVAKGPSKFTMADLELLKSAIKVKGGGQVVDGINFEELKWDGEGLLPIVTQDRRTGAVLLLGHTSKETLEETLRSRKMTYWSRTRNKAWTQGEESGHAARLVKLEVDCDRDAVLAVVDQEGPACHRDTGTCWTEGRALPLAGYLGELDRHIAEVAKNPALDAGLAKSFEEPIEALKRFVAKANQVTQVLQGKPHEHSLEHEAADVLFHLLVACRARGVGLEKMVTELYARFMAGQAKP